jgi:hypothetical protein
MKKSYYVLESTYSGAPNPDKQTYYLCSSINEIKKYLLVDFIGLMDGYALHNAFFNPGELNLITYIKGVQTNKIDLRVYLSLEIKGFPTIVGGETFSFLNPKDDTTENKLKIEQWVESGGIWRDDEVWKLSINYSAIPFLPLDYDLLKINESVNYFVPYINDIMKLEYGGYDFEMDLKIDENYCTEIMQEKHITLKQIENGHYTN